MRLHNAILALAVLLPACGALFPADRSQADRLAQFPTSGLPVQRPVTIRWNPYAIPYIQAETDPDLAFSLGLVHAHLREGQLALAKRIAYGRISEMAGPFAWEIDQTLRTIGFTNAGPAVLERMPAETRRWMQRFVDGLNWYQDHAATRPPEYGLLGISRESWRIEDLLAIGRLAGTDINWLTYFGLIPQHGDTGWQATWKRVLEAGNSMSFSFSPADQQAALSGLLLGHARSGSNSVVVAAGRSRSGGALLASDPHLPTIVPNVWILAGVRSPSFNVVGLMPAGLPIFGLGRSPDMAWSGTNMRAASSDLYDVSAETLESRTERLGTRLWLDKQVTLRRSRLGPLISDAPLFRARPDARIALRWMGHEPSDEVTAFLRASGARTPAEFRAAFASYAVGGQNMQFADARGNIGQIMATWLPRRSYRRPPDLVLDGRDPALQWQGYATAVELPWALNPKEGFLASANNPATQLDQPVSFFFITSERVERLQELLRRNPTVSVGDLRALQLDVTSPASLRLKNRLVAAIEGVGLAGEQPTLLATLRAWQGEYDADAAGPVAFETLLFHVATRVEGGGRDDELRRPRGDWSYLVNFLAADQEALPPARRRDLLSRALAAAAHDTAQFPTWGDMHVMRVQSVFGNIPVIGRQFRIAEYPSSGSRETVMKAAHGLVRERHPVAYGSQSRFIADMSDPDANWFVLFGGQDGWLGSTNLADQMPLWRSGGYIRMPLRQEAIEQEFPRMQVLRPADRP